MKAYHPNNDILIWGHPRDIKDSDFHHKISRICWAAACIDYYKNLSISNYDSIAEYTEVMSKAVPDLMKVLGTQFPDFFPELTEI